MRTTSSAAYDLSQFAPAERERPRVKVVTTKKKNSRNKKAFKVKFVAYMVVLAVLMAGTVYSRFQLTEVKSSINTNTTALTALQSENAYLSYELESMVSLRNAEDYAENELGLVRVDSSQIEYVSLCGGNMIETEEKTENPFVSFFNLVIEFLFG